MSGFDTGIVLVTGGGGFLGSATIRALVARGVTVRAHLGPPGQPAAEPPDGVQTAVADLTDPSTVRALIDDVEIVVHLAGPPSVAESFRDPHRYLRVHAVGTEALLDACRGSGIERFVYASSAEVYGTPDRIPVSEDAPCEPRSPYGAAKLAGELLVRAMTPSFGMRAAILRPFSVYGPGQRATSLLGTVVTQAKAGGPVRIADPRPVRDVVFVDDAAGALVAACEADLPKEPLTANICSGRGVAAGDLARMAAELAGLDRPTWDAERDRPQDLDVDTLVGDPSLAARTLRWRATTEIVDGLRRTLRAPR